MPRAKPTSKSPFPKRNRNSKPRGSSANDDTSARTSKSNDTSLPVLLGNALRDRTFVKLVLSQPLAKSESSTSKVTVRLVEAGGQPKYQWAARSNSQEIHRNLTLDELISEAKLAFGTQFGDAHLFTTEADLTIRWNYGKPPKIKRKTPTIQSQDDADHNRQKQYLIPVGVPCPFLVEIGVMQANGQVKSTMYHKFRQINRYLEFVNDILPHLPATGTIRVVDFGCGKSYLTFALHYLFTKILGRNVSIMGLDVKSDVIDDCNRIAKALNCPEISFQFGRIENYSADGHVHLAVSLHACDTATDDALAAALKWKCDAILAVPCCQHEVCQALTRRSLPGLTEYGILKERFAALATDALRAQFLELHGYKTQVLEFIETEHTPKNLLLRAIRRPESSTTDTSSRQQAYDELKELLGLTNWRLEDNLKHSVGC